MKLSKRVLLFLIIAVMTLVPLVPISGAAFVGDDKIVIVLDPGHGGRDPGAAGIQAEAVYNLDVALTVKEKLEENGNFIVHMTRSTADKYLTIAERLYFADSVNADLAISIHFNSSTAKTISGVEVYGSVLDKYYLGTLGQKIATGVSDAAGITNRGVFRKYDYGTTLYYWSEEYQWDIPGDSSVGGLSDYYGVITWGAKFGIPSLIIEHAYLSHPTEIELIDDPDVRRAMGEADAKAIIDYYTNHTHNYGDTVTDAPVTCFSAGKQSEHCTVCGHRKNVRSIAASPDPDKHIWLVDGTETPATCESDGYAKYYCRYTHNLNDKGCTQFEVHRKEQVTEAYGHSYEVTFHRDVTHAVDGITTYTCSRCSGTYNETVPAEGHSYSLSSHANPTCTEDGHDTYSCSVCDESYSDKIPMTGHSFTVSDHIDPTCEKDGSEHHTCSSCGFEEDVTIPRLDHDYVIYSDVLPNCTEEGLRTLKCNICGHMKEEVKEISEHSFVIDSDIPPTCETKGELHKICFVCGFDGTYYSDPLGHSYEILDKTPPTCTEDGSVSKKCTVCGASAVDKIPATDHSYDAGTVVNAAGLFSTGIMQYKCLTDSTHVKTDIIPKLTLSQYIKDNTGTFAIFCIIAIVVLAGIGILVFMIIRSKKNSFNRRRQIKEAAPIPEVSFVVTPDSAEAKNTEDSSIEK